MGEVLKFKSDTMADLFLESYDKGDVKTLLSLLRLYAVERGLCGTENCTDCPFKGGCHLPSGKEQAIDFVHAIMANKNPSWGYEQDKDLSD